MCIETALRLKIGFAPIVFYVLVFLATIVFYAQAYIQEKNQYTSNERSLWFVKNHKQITTLQAVYISVSAVLCLLLLPNVYSAFTQNLLHNLFYVVPCPLAAFFYYVSISKINLRNTHWLKPFVIGFVWSGLVTLFPIYYYQLQSNISLHLTNDYILIFIKNLMYISVLCIMFDIKDYASDFNHHLKTFVVSFGLRKTIFFIIVPLTTIGFACFIVVALVKNMSTLSIAVNTIPFIALLYTAFSLAKRKPIMYYLMVIDGLMLLKAVCGIVASKL